VDPVGADLDLRRRDARVAKCAGNDAPARPVRRLEHDKGQARGVARQHAGRRDAGHARADNHDIDIDGVARGRAAVVRGGQTRGRG
jgi:hypothetical protein